MKYLFPILFALMVSACEKGKPLNMEADLLELDFAEKILDKKVSVNSEIINIYLDTALSLFSLTPILTITEGATVYPASGIPQNFSRPVIYTVTSEDRKYSRSYKISLVARSSWAFSFESWDSVDNAYQNPKGWSSGNAGVQTLNVLLPPNKKVAYPTFKSSNTSWGSGAVELQTRKGGQSILVPKLIAGSVFLGSFNTSSALVDPLLCPQFGVPFTTTEGLPDRLTGQLRYKSGDVYQDATGTEIPMAKDTCAFYAVFFEGNEPLSAKDISSSPRIIARAELTSPLTDEWTYVNIPFVYFKSVPKGVNLQMAIVGSSSIGGDYYRGAPNSRLLIDEVKILFKEAPVN